MLIFKDSWQVTADAGAQQMSAKKYLVDKYRDYAIAVRRRLGYRK